MPNKELVTRVTQIGAEEERVLEFIASTETPDRSGDILDVDGWKTDAYIGSTEKNGNPVFAWGHDYSKLPVGKTLSVMKDLASKALKIRVWFPSIEDMNTDPAHPSEPSLFADTVYNAYKKGLLNAVSVGFNPIKWEPRTDPEMQDKPTYARGMHFIEQELLEVSAVVVPCNAEALITGRSVKQLNPALDEKILKVFSSFGLVKSEEKKEPEVQEKEVPTVPKENELSDVAKSVEEIKTAVEKRGSRFSTETRKVLGEVTDAMKACRKGIAACEKAIEGLMAEPEEVKPEDEESPKALREPETKAVEKAAETPVKEAVEKVKGDLRLDSSTLLSDVEKLFSVEEE
jgi:hypothetical protein